MNKKKEEMKRKKETYDGIYDAEELNVRKTKILDPICVLNTLPYSQLVQKAHGSTMTCNFDLFDLHIRIAITELKQTEEKWVEKKKKN